MNAIEPLKLNYLGILNQLSSVKVERDIKQVILHCSDSKFGDANTINTWHKARGWKGIGYHYVILNGITSPEVRSDGCDGMIEIGRTIDEIGAHVKGQNSDSIGICLICEPPQGRFVKPRELLTEKQLESLYKLLDMIKHKIGKLELHGHYEYANKTCPGFRIEDL